MSCTFYLLIPKVETAPIYSLTYFYNSLHFLYKNAFSSSNFAHYFTDNSFIKTFFKLSTSDFAQNSWWKFISTWSSVLILRFIIASSILFMTLYTSLKRLSTWCMLFWLSIESSFSQNYDLTFILLHYWGKNWYFSGGFSISLNSWTVSIPKENLR